MTPLWDTGALRALSRVAPALPVVAVAIAAAVQLGWRTTGTIAAADWLGFALVAGLAVTVVLASGSASRPHRLAATGLATLAALSAWTALSAAWSPLPSLAKEEAQLVLLYVLAFALALLTVRTSAERVAALAALAFVPGGVALATGIELLGAARPDELFDSGRLQFPVSYANAAAALFLLSFWPAIALAAGRAVPLLLRAAAVGSAAAGLAAWIATQSKGGGIGLVVSGLVVFALTPARLRLAVPLALAVMPAAAAATVLTAPYRTEGAGAAAASGRAIVLVTAVALAAGLVYSLLDRRVRLGERAIRRAGAIVAATLALAAVASASLLVASTGRPDRALADAWSSFTVYHSDADSATHLTSLGGSNRYDFWRVALAGAADEPLAGIGARGFGALYLQEGRSNETPARAHSLLLDVLLEQGAVGLLLLLAGLGAPLVLVVRAARQRRLHAIAALGGCSAWIAQASVDWTWTFPSVGVLFFLLLGLGAGNENRALSRRVSTSTAAVTALTAVVVLGGPWLSARLLERAAAQPDRAAQGLRWAKRLDPISVQPYLVEANLAQSTPAAIAALEQAAAKEPDSVATRYLLGITLLAAGEKAQARAELEAAVRLFPGDPFVRAALARARA